MRIVLKQERKIYVLDQPIPDEPAADVPRAQQDAYTKHIDDFVDVGCLMLATMVPELQRDLEHMEAFGMLVHLKEMFQQQARQERYETTKALFFCKMAEGASVSPHVFNMKGYIDHLERLGFPMSQELATDVILNSLPGSYDNFVMDYNMNNMEESIFELHGMLKIVELSLKKRPSTVLSVPKQRGMKRKAKKAKPPKDRVCFF